LAVSTNFNVFVAEYECKMAEIRPTRNQYNFKTCDSLLNYAFKQHASFRGHTLIWHEYLPQWVLWISPQERRNEMVQHVKTVMGRYKGKIRVWDVVNEALLEEYNPNQVMYKYSPLYEGNPDYVELAFRTARQVDSKARLFYNDYGTQDSETPHSKNQLKMVTTLKQKGVPIDGVGFQCHIKQNEFITYESMIRTFEPYVKLGLEVQITELGVECPNPCDQQRQATIYLNMLKACIDTPRCTAFVTWGMVDTQSWLPDKNAFLFTKEYVPKHAYNTILNYLKGLKKIPKRQYARQ
jgi:GH35 family endo-1,4-beta-xylanase